MEIEWTWDGESVAEKGWGRMDFVDPLEIQYLTKDWYGEK